MPNTEKTPEAQVAEMTLAECAQLVDDLDEAYGETLAEVGSSAFMLYGNAADANAVAYAEVPNPSSFPEYRAAKARLETYGSIYRLVRVIHYDPTDLPF